MARTARTLASALLMAALLPSAAGAQEIEPIPIDPRPIVPCDVDCWWPVGTVAQLDTIEAEIDVADGRMIARYRFGLSNPMPDGTDVGTPNAEGRIVFPVPAGSSVTDLVLSGGPETLEGRLLDADEATLLYEDIVRRLIDPALLRSLEGDLYEVRAFPVPAGEEREVSFTVTTPLLAEGEQAVVEVPWSRMSPRPADAVVTVDVDVPWEVRSALAPGFDIDSDREGDGELALGWESTDGWTPDADFRLYLGGGDGLVDTRLLAYRERGEDGYFALLFAPEVDADESVARDIVSCSTRRARWRARSSARRSTPAVYVLEHLGERRPIRDRRLLANVHAFSDELQPASEAEAGIEYLRELSAGGNTNISGALDGGLGLLDGERPGTVIFLTDGLPPRASRTPTGIVDVAAVRRSERTQLFAFGVGYDVDTVLLDALSTQLVGSEPLRDPRRAHRHRGPAALRAGLDARAHRRRGSIDGVETYDIAPEGMTGIFAGNQALLTGRYDGSGTATVVVTGDSSQGPERFEYTVEFPGARRGRLGRSPSCGRSDASPTS